MRRYNIAGWPYPAVRAASYAEAAERLLRRAARLLHGNRVYVGGIRQEAGSYDGASEIWRADVMLPLPGQPGERLWGGDRGDGNLTRTIVDLGPVRSGGR